MLPPNRYLPSPLPLPLPPLQVALAYLSDLRRLTALELEDYGQALRQARDRAGEGQGECQGEGREGQGLKGREGGSGRRVLWERVKGLQIESMARRFSRSQCTVHRLGGREAACVCKAGG